MEEKSTLQSKILFLALFATGLSGIVAEYAFATLSTYFIGDSVKQWSIVISLMLFCMGLGARFTRSKEGNVFLWFILTEFALSFIVAFSSVLTYYLAARIEQVAIFIYSMAGVTGVFIGMELPLAMRLNKEFQSLRLNVSNVLEKDYYGSLIGGLFFVFIGLPYLGLSHTPFILGFVNLGVALVLLYTFRTKLDKGWINRLWVLGFGMFLLLSLGMWKAEAITFYGEQARYKDKIVYEEQTQYQKIVITQWKKHYWLYLNHNLQFSSFDEAMYHEVLVHPAMHLLDEPRKVLILGGGDGCAARELLKYKALESITLVDLDKRLTDLFQEKEYLRKINQSALLDAKVKLINTDAFRYMEDCQDFFDLIIIDLPDPKSIELSRMYSKEFYQLCHLHLRPKGGLITQAGSPYYAPEAFYCIKETMRAADFSVLPLHNQVMTMGEWGWVFGAKAKQTKSALLKKLVQWPASIETRWLNREAMQLISSFGKIYPEQAQDSLINTISDPQLYKVYNNANWDTY